MFPYHLLGSRARARATTRVEVVRDHLFAHHPSCKYLDESDDLRPGLLDLTKDSTGLCCAKTLGAGDPLANTLRFCRTLLAQPLFVSGHLEGTRNAVRTRQRPSGTARLVAHTLKHVERTEARTQEWFESGAAAEALDLAATLRTHPGMRRDPDLRTPFAADADPCWRMPMTLEEYCSSTPVGHDWREELTSLHHSRPRPDGYLLVLSRYRSVSRLLMANGFLAAALANGERNLAGSILVIPRSLAPLLRHPQRAPRAPLTTAVLTAGDTEAVIETAVTISPPYETASRLLRAARALER